MPKSLTITQSKINENILSYIVKDNGSGFNYNPNAALNHGLDITRERINILFNEMKKNVKFTILSSVDGSPSGTKIIIEIPIIKD